MTAKNLKDTFQYFIILVLVVSMLILIAMLFKIKLPEENKEIALLLIGQFSAKFADGISFLINSSKGSAEKSETISKLPPLPDSDTVVSSVKVETTQTDTTV